MTLKETAAVFQTILPLKISERQVLNLMQPVGEQFICCEDQQKARIFEEATEKHTASQTKEQARPEEIERMYIELDGVLARYFRSNAERMRYPLFRAQSMQVGSGVAEAADLPQLSCYREPSNLSLEGEVAPGTDWRKTSPSFYYS